ncbi:hypothetical protein FG877_02120 [Enterococcus casseliflavus]|nr:hypothetical protein [Enterococcus casseliflavus]
MAKMINGILIGREKDKQVRNTGDIAKELIYEFADRHPDYLTIQEAYDKMVQRLGVSDEELSRTFFEMHPNKKSILTVSYFENEVRSAKGVLQGAGIVRTVPQKAGIWELTNGTNNKDLLLQQFIAYLDKNRRVWGKTILELQQSIINTLEEFDGKLLRKDLIEQVKLDMENEYLEENIKHLQKDFAHGLNVLRTKKILKLDSNSEKGYVEFENNYQQIILQDARLDLPESD